MEQKKTFKQVLLKYLAEIIIIVIGVSISITMNQWQNEKKATQDEVELLKEIQHDLVQDSATFATYSQIIEQNIKWGLPLVIQDDLEAIEDSLLFFISVVPNFVPFEGTTVGYTYLKGLGGFNLIEDKLLLKDIIQIYSSYYPKLELFSNSQSKYIQEQIIPYYNRNIPLITSIKLEGMGAQLEPLMAAIQSQEYRNMVKVHLSMMNQYLNAYKATNQKIRPLLEKIKQEIKIKE